MKIKLVLNHWLEALIVWTLILNCRSVYMSTIVGAKEVAMFLCAISMIMLLLRMKQISVRKLYNGILGAFGLLPRHGEHHAGGFEPVFHVPGLAGLPGEGAACPAAAVPGGQPGTDPRGIRAARGGGTVPGQGAAGAAHGDYLLHGHPGFGGEVYHCGGAGAGQGGDLPKGKDPHHPAAGQAVPEALKVRQKTKDRLR